MSSPERTINFTRGVPADDAFPAAELADCVTAVLRERPVQVLQYGPSTGFLPLREWLAERHGVPVDHVLVGNGSLPFIDLLGWALLERGDTVLVESPTYDRTLTLLRRHGVRIVGVPINGGGLDLDALEAAVRATPPRLLYTIPDFQNPAGATATLAVRRRVAAGGSLRAGAGGRVGGDAARAARRAVEGAGGRLLPSAPARGRPGVRGPARARDRREAQPERRARVLSRSRGWGALRSPAV